MYKFRLYSILCFAVLILPSCRKEQTKNTSTVKYNSTFQSTDPNFLSIDATQIIAERLTKDFFQNNVSEPINRPIINSYSINDRNDIPSMYVFNYEGGGFSVISADYRYEPILAFVEEGSLMPGDAVPDMLAEWVGFNMEQIQDIRDSIIPDTADIPVCYTRWANTIQDLNVYNEFITVKQYIPEREINCGPEVMEITPPIMLTKWGQNAGFNDLVNSSLNCTTTGNTKPPTGCVTTAVGMLLKFWSVPNVNYNYSSMPNSTGSFETQKLMRDLGASSHLDVNYNCSGTGTNSTKVKPTLESKFGFSSGGTYRNYVTADRWVIRNEILAGKPVYLDGCASNNPIIFNIYGNCHAWLVTGYKMIGNSCIKHFYYSMNWGWQGELNGWYYEPHWNANVNNNFQYSKELIFNIHP